MRSCASTGRSASHRKGSGSDDRPPLLRPRGPHIARAVAPNPRTWRIPLWHRLLRRSASESGRLCHGDGGHEWGARRRRLIVLYAQSGAGDRRGSCRRDRRRPEERAAALRTRPGAARHTACWPLPRRTIRQSPASSRSASASRRRGPRYLGSLDFTGDLAVPAQPIYRHRLGGIAKPLARRDDECLAEARRRMPESLRIGELAPRK
jgi:hypothetical protein